jgi:hypothetical protein
MRQKNLEEKLKKQVKPLPIKYKQGQFTNDPKLKAQINFGENFFKREVNPEKSRVGYFSLLDKL